MSHYDGKQRIVIGSNSFAVSLVNKIISEQGLHTATQSELERILKLGILDLRGVYEDSGLVLRDNQEPNSYLARDLIRQLDNTKLPVMIPLKNVELRNDDDSPYGLAFNLIGEVIHVPILNGDSRSFSSENIDEETGLPKKLGEGNRYLYKRETGLSRLYFNRGSYLGSDDELLACSDGIGRVVVVSGSAAQKI